MPVAFCYGRMQPPSTHGRLLVSWCQNRRQSALQRKAEAFINGRPAAPSQFLSNEVQQPRSWSPPRLRYIPVKLPLLNRAHDADDDARRSTTVAIYRRKF